MNFSPFKRLGLIMLLIATPFILQAQLSKKENKVIKKANKLSEKKKYAEAIEKIKPLTISQSDEPEVWEAYVTYHWNKYESMVNLGSNLNFTIKSSDENDSLSNSLVALLKKAFTGAKEEKDYIDAMRLATLKCRGLDNIGVQLRSAVIDKKIKIDTNISKAAKDWFNKAEDQFVAGNYKKAADYYQKAIDIDSHYYRARLYLGDCFYALKDYSSAAPIFRNAIEIQPELIEPRKYYFDALFKMRSFDKAMECGIAAIMVYPEENMINKLNQLAVYQGAKFDRNWMPRPYFPFSSKEKDQTATDHWKYYFEAADKIAPHVSKIGTLNPNDVTKEIYPEVYCWEYMLAKASPDVKELKTAREMKNLNKLDCYVLFSLSHIDLADQAKHLAENNSEKVSKYIQSWIE